MPTQTDGADELTAALALAEDAELDELVRLLFSRRFNPLDYLQAPEPAEIRSRSR